MFPKLPPRGTDFWTREQAVWKPFETRPAVGVGPFYTCTEGVFGGEASYCERGPVTSILKYNYLQRIGRRFRRDKMTGRVEYCKDCGLGVVEGTYAVLLPRKASPKQPADVVGGEVVEFTPPLLDGKDYCNTYPPPQPPGGTPPTTPPTGPGIAGRARGGTETEGAPRHADAFPRPLELAASL